MLVGFEQSSYTVDENVGQFQVCVVLTIPPQSDPLNRTFILRISTRPDTAGIRMYVSQPCIFDVVVTFHIYC